MRPSKSTIYQAVIWAGIWAISLFLGSFGDAPDGFFALLTARILWLAVFFNVVYHGLLPLYFSGRKRLFLVFSILAFACFVGSSLIINKFENRELRNPRFRPAQTVGPPSRPPGFQLVPPIFLGLLMFGLAGSLRGFSAYEKKKREEAEANRRRTEAELALLKAQMNPHFLLNTLNNLYALALTDPEKTPAALLKLSEMVRFILHECQQPKIALEKDLAFVENYIALQKMRLPHNVDLRVELPAKTAPSEIEPMILIPFIENAFEHGITTRQPCAVFISIETTEKQLVLRVENDNLPPKTAAAREKPGIGLANTRQRLDSAYAGKHVLFIKNEFGKHFVELTIEL